MIINDILTWGKEFIISMNVILSWLFTETTILSYTVRPIYLVVGTLFVAGIVRRIVF